MGLAVGELPWVVEVLVNECERCQATQLQPYIAKANDLLERLESSWRITQAGEPLNVPVAVTCDLCRGFGKVDAVHKTDGPLGEIDCPACGGTGTRYG